MPGLQLMGFIITTPLGGEGLPTTTHCRRADLLVLLGDVALCLLHDIPSCQWGFSHAGCSRTGCHDIWSLDVLEINILKGETRLYGRIAL